MIQKKAGGQWTRRRLKWLGIGMLLFLMLVFLTLLVLNDNLHTVVPNELYRSAQLSPRRLQHVMREWHIRSVINLRGYNPQAGWYRDEVAVTRVMGVKHYDIAFSSRLLPDPRYLRQLIHVFQTAPKPILLHCEGGADRSGFASAMYLLLEGKSVKVAREQISLFYHVFSDQSLGYLVLPIYVAWLKERNVKSNRQYFLRWVSETNLKSSL